MLVSSAMICLALNIYHEARGEPEVGRQAVAMVTLNRAGYDHSKVCDVVFEPHQMSWTTGTVSRQGPYFKLDESLRPKEKKVWERCKAIAARNLKARQKDPTRGATHFHTTEVRPKWARYAIKTARLGNHFFYTFDKSGVTEQ